MRRRATVTAAAALAAAPALATVRATLATLAAITTGAATSVGLPLRSGAWPILQRGDDQCALSTPALR